MSTDSQDTKSQMGAQKRVLLRPYCVAVIDVLGQSDTLTKLRGIPTDCQKRIEAEKTIEQTFGVVRLLRDTFRAGYRRYQQNLQNGTSVPGLLRDMGLKAPPCRIGFQPFADTTVAYVSLGDSANPVSSVGILGVLHASALTFLAFLAEGHPMRGGIDAGLAAELTNNEIYGPALVRAHILESKVAEYPRIVVGSDLVAHLDDVRSSGDNSLWGRQGTMRAEFGEQLVSADADGSWILDYLGEFMRKNASETKLKLVGQAFQHAKAQAPKYKRERNGKLAFRYAMLLRYFEERASLWKEVIQ